MNNSVILKQKISLVSKSLVCSPLLYFILFLTEQKVWNFVLALIFIPIFGFNYQYVFLQNKTRFLELRVFNFKIYSYEKNFINPEYLSVVHQSYVDDSSRWMYDMFLDVRFKLYTIKFFKGNNHETVFKTSNKEEVIQKTIELSKLLNVRINNTLNNSST